MSKEKLEKEIEAIENIAEQLRSWNLKYHPFPDIKKFIKENWHQKYGDDVIYKYLSEVMRDRSNSYWNVDPYSRGYANEELQNAKLAWKGTKADLRGDFSVVKNPRKKVKKHAKKRKKKKSVRKRS